MRYTVTKAFRPKGSGGPEAAVGSELELNASQGRVFKAVGFVKDAEAKPEPPKPFVPPPYVRRDQTAEQSSDETSEPAKKTTRRYQRRDMTAKTED